MERAITVEERIRKAEEIYQRRKNGNIEKDKKQPKKRKKMLKRMIIQIINCSVIYILILTVQNKEYIFSENFLNKAKEVLSCNIDTAKYYNNVKEYIEKNIMEKEEKEEKLNEENKEEGEKLNQENLEGIGGIDENKENVIELSQEEQDIQNVKLTTNFIKPIEGIISSKYGQRDQEPKNHTGTDIAATLGTKIKASTDGEVVIASEEGDYGKHLKIQIGDVSIVYAHCNNLYVSQGDIVKQGQEIAEVGTTGRSTGPHLHFEVRISNRTVDPQSILEL